MQPGDIILVELNSGPRLVRYAETKSNRVRLSIGRNREARLPVAKVIHETGVNAPSFDAVEEFAQRAESVAGELDLEELWDIVCDDGDALALSDLGELYWGAEPDAVQEAGLLLHLLRDDLRFVRDGEYYLPRDRETVAQTLERRQRQERRAADTEALAAAVRSRQLPDELSAHQSDLMAQVREFVLHGDEYARANAVKRFLESAGVSGRDVQRAAFETLAALGMMREDEHLALEREDIMPEFPPTALAEAEAIDDTTLLSDSTRLDLTGSLVFSIDDADTRDRDDAISIEPGESEGSYRLGVHITDAGALIPPDSDLDLEADRRMSSLYLPEQTISMLPPAVSTERGSLNPGERRAAMSVFVELSESDGESEGSGEWPANWEVARSVIRSDRALSYAEADEAITDANHPLYDELSALNGLAKSLRKRREKNGALNLNRDELTVKVNADGEISVSVAPRDGASRAMIEEFMVLCNSLLARYCQDAALPAPFRSQPRPEVSDIEAQVPEGPLRWYMMTRRLAPASVGTKPGAHGGLGVESYTQATSPLRRYPDLMVQRQISHHLRTGETLYDEEAVTSIAHRADTQVRQMSRIENRRRQYFFLKWLDARRLSAEADGGAFVLEAVTLENPPNRTALLELADWPFRTRAALPNSVAPGDRATLRLHGVDLWRQTAQFTLASD